MASRFIITHHALNRFRERPSSSENGNDELVLLNELKHSVPFLAQRGPGKLYLLPCGVVAAVVRDRACLIVKTILTREQAIAQIEASGSAVKRLAS